MNKSINIIYILGLGFSGSTLLSFVLNTHPDIFTIGEVGPSPEIKQNDFPCSCGQTIPNCSFWKRVKNEMSTSFNEILNLDNLDMRYYYSKNVILEALLMGRLKSHFSWALRNKILHPIFPGFKHRIDRLNKRNFAFMKVALDINKSNFFLDASKNWNRLFYLNQIPNVNLKVIHLVRSPYGFCNSAKKRTNWALSNSAFSWKNQTLDNIYILKNFIPNSEQIVVNYEFFCQEPDETLKKITTFIGTDPIEKPDNFRNHPHHIIGNKMRESSNDKRTDIILDEKWKGNMTREDITSISQIVFPLASKFGYTPH